MRFHASTSKTRGSLVWFSEVAGISLPALSLIERGGDPREVTGGSGAGAVQSRVAPRKENPSEGDDAGAQERAIEDGDVRSP